jgi:hypothetical protein
MGNMADRPDVDGGLNLKQVRYEKAHKDKM